MGEKTFTKSSYTSAKSSYGIESDTDVTYIAEQEAKKTGKLKPTVDPSVDAVRRSLVRFNPTDDGFIVTVGCPMDIESICDTTGSMGNNVDVAMKVLPQTYSLVSKVLPGYDPQLALGTFADVSDDWVFQRPQFEMTAERIVEYLKDMVPERRGGDSPEDPQYGLFGATFLTSTYTNSIGLKGYHFLISDAPGREYGLNSDGLIRVFGEDVFKRVADNDHQLNKADIPSTSTKELVRHLSKRAHTFFLQVDDYPDARHFWTNVYGPDRVISLPDTEYLPHVQAVIIGLTEGTLKIDDVKRFLIENNLSEKTADKITQAVSNVPLGEQAKLREKLGHSVPKVGDIFRNKSDLWPIGPSESISSEPTEPEKSPSGWL